MSATFLLVHGTWHGGWVWSRVRAHLERAGAAVFSPTLTGVGERAHLATPETGLETHVQDIAAVIEAEELSGVTLVCHSFSGVAAAGAAARQRARIKEIVFFDALVPRPGRMSALEKAADGALPAWWLKRREKFIDGYLMDFFADYPLEMLVPAADKASQAYLRRRLTPHPAKTWTDELAQTDMAWESLPKAYIRAAAQVYQPSSDAMPGPAKGGPGWTWLDLPTPRNGMLTHPRLLADALLRLAKS